MSLIACKQDHTNIKNDFQNPQQQHQPRTWWRWLNGNISKDGITKDLEAINDKGMNGVTLFNLGAYYPKGPVDFMSEEWLKMFDFSVDECERLNLDFSFQMCDGWGASGGPWVTKEHAMKFTTSSKVTIKGGQKVNITLPQPHTKLDYYKDIKVLAFPAIDTSTHYFTPDNVKVSYGGWVIDKGNLIDGDRYSAVNFGYNEGQPHVIDFEMKKPVTVSAVNVHQGPRETPVGPEECQLQYSKDGNHYTTVATFKLDDIKGGTAFEPVKAKYFRLNITAWTTRSGDGRWAFLSEVELLSPENITRFPKINDFEIKASIWHRRRGLDEVKPVPENWIVDKDKIIDVTNHFDDGKLRWDAPDGYWTIVRMGYTLTGRENGPATIKGTGLECDKLNKQSVKVFYDGYAGKLLDRNKAHCGKTITRLFADSFEALAQNWTPGMFEAFKKHSGYDLTPYLLALSGEVVGSVDVTERVLFDLRKTLSAMLSENYYAYLNELCHNDQVEFVAQASGEQQMLANPMLYSSMVDHPATEFWVAGGLDTNWIRPNGSVFDAISAAHVYDKKVIPTEAFTSKISDFSITPTTMKPIGDKAFAYGINQFEMHTYIHQPDDEMPGWQHNGFGISWGRKITWWDMAAGKLTGYFTRAQTLLQQGQPVADIILYTGEEIPNSIEFAYHVHDPYQLIPKGYKFDAINSHALLNRLTVENGLFTLPNGLKYKVLLLPPSDKMSVEVIEKLRSFVSQGGIIIGQKPQNVYGLHDLEANRIALQEIAGELWNNNRKGKIYADGTMQEVLKKEGIFPDFSYKANETTEIVFCHRKIGNKDVYFLSNQNKKPVTIDAIFRQYGKTPEIWDAETGEILKQNLYVERKNGIAFPLSLRSLASKFVVFTPGKENHFVSVEHENTTLYPYQDNITSLPFCTQVDGKMAFSRQGAYSFKTSKDKKVEYKIPAIPEAMQIQPPWKVSFDQKWGGPASITFDSLFSWTDHTHTGIKYYSGTAVYSKTIHIKQSMISEKTKVLLDLGRVREVAEVFVNGKQVAVLWNPDFICDISKYVNTGDNNIKIHVTNTWNNRLAGDDLHPGNERYTYFPLKGYRKDSERRQYKEKDMMVSGLLGPVKICFSRVIEMDK